MQTYPMQDEEYPDIARQFLREADANFIFDEHLAGAERMWDAAAHAIIAVCQHRNWPHWNRADLDSSVMRLTDELRNAGREDEALGLEAGYVVACNSHINFYHRDMDLDGGNGRYFAMARGVVHRFVEGMLAMSESTDE